MLVITHKIITDSLQIDRTTGLLPIDSLERFDVAIKLDRNAMINGRSLLSSIQPIEYCLDILRWTDVIELAGNLPEIRRRYYNPGRVKLLPFQPGSLFVPFKTLNP